jgi:hypothetical protein
MLCYLAGFGRARRSLVRLRLVPGCDAIDGRQRVPCWSPVNNVRGTRKFGAIAYSVGRVSIHWQISHRNVRSSGYVSTFGRMVTSFMGAPHLGHLISGAVSSGTGTGGSPATVIQSRL